MAIPLLNKFKMPRVGTYDKTKGLLEHLNIFKGWMDLYDYNDVIKC